MASELEDRREVGIRILLSHEWIAPIGGSENVFRQMLKTFPSADAVCLWNEVPQTFSRPIRETSLAASPLRKRKALALFRMPAAWRGVDLAQHDVVVSSSHAFGHHLATRAVRDGRLGFAYVHTPARYIWAPEVETRGQSLPARVASTHLRRLDRKMTDERVNLAANSQFVRERIDRAWGMDAQVIYPSVEVEELQATPRWRDRLEGGDERIFDGLPTDGYVFGASRLVGYKNLEATIDVGAAMGVPVVIAGTGPHEEALRVHAVKSDVPVHFVGRVSDTQLRALYQEAILFVFVAIEDFGIMPVEAMALGTPVVVNRLGGAAESVARCGGGSTAEPGDSVDLREAADRALSVDRDLMARATQQFSAGRFRTEMESWVSEKVKASR